MDFEVTLYVERPDVAAEATFALLPSTWNVKLVEVGMDVIILYPSMAASTSIICKSCPSIRS